MVELICGWLLGFVLNLNLLTLSPHHCTQVELMVGFLQHRKSGSCLVGSHSQVGCPFVRVTGWALSDAIPGRSQRQWYTNAILVTVKLQEKVKPTYQVLQNSFIQGLPRGGVLAGSRGEAVPSHLIVLLAEQYRMRLKLCEKRRQPLL